ncbi:iron complex transport system permease protein [Halovenus aranensis]|jgi:iron complex transport system permease protein|uniref:Cobalamin import system permease protein BtuC n=1 Tax=Halovenus aranensis TaxID=890420 RepID=A0A1G8U7D4_9EURY|nr:vitamin B12 ABC transporter permease BtuC [Halovenus aranensis]SDJ49641.1 iron complex transport system permease protein [Halovenus aranensis]
MRVATRAVVWSGGLFALLCATILVSAGLGPVRVDVPTVARATLNTVAVPAGLSVGLSDAALAGLSVPVPSVDVSYTGLFSFDVPETEQLIVGRLRLPRIVLGAVVGFGLSTAGTVMQGFFRNPMADPSIIGVSSGAAVGAVAVIAFSLSAPLQAAAFASAIVTAFAVYVIATENGRTPVATLLLAGVAIQTFLGAAISYMLLQSGNSMEQVVVWLMGHLSNSQWSEVEITLPLTVLLFVALLAYARDLNVMLLGEEDAHALGIDVEWTKRILLGGSAVITAAGVAVAGPIGFVGLVVPHVMRLIVGPDHRILIPTSALAGATFLVLADTVARAGPAEVPVGIVTAAVGAPFFLFLLRQREVHSL